MEAMTNYEYYLSATAETSSSFCYGTNEAGFYLKLDKVLREVRNSIRSVQQQGKVSSAQFEIVGLAFGPDENNVCHLTEEFSPISFSFTDLSKNTPVNFEVELNSYKVHKYAVELQIAKRNAHYTVEARTAARFAQGFFPCSETNWKVVGVRIRIVAAICNQQTTQAEEGLLGEDTAAKKRYAQLLRNNWKTVRNNLDQMVMCYDYESSQFEELRQKIDTFIEDMESSRFKSLLK